MFALRPTRAPDTAELDRVERLVRARYCVDGHALVLVSEEAGRQPGLPERMTTVLFWIGPDARHRIRVFKPVARVEAEDLPARWLRGALLDEGEGDCC